VTGGERVRVVVAWPGAPDRGAEVVARALRDAGMEVVYAGPDQTPEELAATAVQEDVDAVVLAGAPEGSGTLVARLTELLGARGGDDVAVVPADAAGPQVVDRVRAAVGADPTG
jgi:methylmalonyl-CoA mutase C-terminal domain/subunit